MRVLDFLPSILVHQSFGIQRGCAASPEGRFPSSENPCMEETVISALKKTLTLRVAKTLAWGPYRNNCSQDSNPGLSGTEASNPGSIPAHLFWWNILRSHLRQWALVREWFLPLLNPRELEEAMGCLELVSRAIN